VFLQTPNILGVKSIHSLQRKHQISGVLSSTFIFCAASSILLPYENSIITLTNKKIRTENLICKDIDIYHHIHVQWSLNATVVSCYLLRRAKKSELSLTLMVSIDFSPPTLLLERRMVLHPLKVHTLYKTSLPP